MFHYGILVVMEVGKRPLSKSEEQAWQELSTWRAVRRGSINRSLRRRMITEAEASRLKSEMHQEFDARYLAAGFPEGSSVIDGHILFAHGGHRGMRAHSLAGEPLCDECQKFADSEHANYRERKRRAGAGSSEKDLFLSEEEEFGMPPEQKRRVKAYFGY